MKRVFFLLSAFLSFMAIPSEAADYNILNYGAKSDTTMLSTTALQQAIDDCSKAGGGRVVVCVRNDT